MLEIKDVNAESAVAIRAFAWTTPSRKGFHIKKILVGNFEKNLSVRGTEILFRGRGVKFLRPLR